MKGFYRASYSCDLQPFPIRQATEPAVDLAVEQQISFAVCPCCVFPPLFSSASTFLPEVVSYLLYGAAFCGLCGAW